MSGWRPVPSGRIHLAPRELVRANVILGSSAGLDPGALRELVNHRVKINDALATSDLPLVINAEPPWTLGLVGVVNAIAGNDQFRLAWSTPTGSEKGEGSFMIVEFTPDGYAEDHFLLHLLHRTGGAGILMIHGPVCGRPGATPSQWLPMERWARDEEDASQITDPSGTAATVVRCPGCWPR